MSQRHSSMTTSHFFQEAAFQAQNTYQHNVQPSREDQGEPIQALNMSIEEEDSLRIEGEEDGASDGTPETSNIGQQEAMVPYEEAETQLTTRGSDDLSLAVHSRTSRHSQAQTRYEDEQLRMHNSFATGDYIGNLVEEAAQGPDSRALIAADEHARSLVPVPADRALVPDREGGALVVTPHSDMVPRAENATDALVPVAQDGLSPYSMAYSDLSDESQLVVSKQQTAYHVDQDVTHHVMPAGGDNPVVRAQTQHPVVEGENRMVPVQPQHVATIGADNRLVPVQPQYLANVGAENRLVPVQPQHLAITEENRMVPAQQPQQIANVTEENQIVPVQPQHTAIVTEENRMVPVQPQQIANVTEENQMVPVQPQHAAIVRAENQMVPVQMQPQYTADAPAMEGDDPVEVGQIRQQHEDEVSLAPEDIFGQRYRAARATDEVDNKSVVSEAQGSGWTRPYEAPAARSTDDETINTYGSSFWNKSAGKPDTIYEGDQEESSYADPSRHSSRSSTQHTSRTSTQHSFRTSAEYTTASSPSTRSIRSVYETSGGVLNRAGAARRQDRTREVEVSMDGFLHQAKPMPIPEETLDPDPFDFQPILIDDSRPRAKLSNRYRICTILAACGLAATMMFFAVQVGPFYAQTATPRRINTAGNNNNQNVQSSFERIAPTTNSSVFPEWMTYTFLDWRRSYLGVSAEVPFIWTMEQSGGEVFVEVMSACLNKVIAGDGRQHDPDGEHGALWEADSFKILTVSGGQRFINVDLYSVDGVIRAGDLQLTQSRVAELVDSPFLKEGALRLFAPTAGEMYPAVSGRLMIVFREPMDRALNRYEQTKLTTGDDAMTLADYWNNPLYSENNPLTRSIVGLGPNDPLNRNEIEMAQKIINRHVLVGLYNNMEETVLRYEQFLHWHTGSTAKVAECRTRVLSAYERGYRTEAEPYRVSDPNGYNMLASDHGVDNLIYAFAQRLFEVQGQALSSIQSS